MLITNNTKNAEGRLLKVSGSGGIRDAVLSGNRISDVGSGQAPIVDLGTSEACGFAIYGNQFRRSFQAVRFYQPLQQI